MSRTEIEATEWAKRFKVEYPSSYEEAIKLAAILDHISVQKRGDHSLQFDYFWAITSDCPPDFWLGAIPTQKEAVAVCRSLKWCVLL
jgi:hypothetical protein